jgi:hypothetical protein
MAKVAKVAKVDLILICLISGILKLIGQKATVCSDGLARYARSRNRRVLK